MEFMGEEAEPAVLDAALIVTAQRMHHYQMAGYGCLRTFALGLGYVYAADWLQETLDEEGAADRRLTEVAETIVNAKACAAGCASYDST